MDYSSNFIKLFTVWHYIVEYTFMDYFVAQIIAVIAAISCSTFSSTGGQFQQNFYNILV